MSSITFLLLIFFFYISCLVGLSASKVRLDSTKTFSNEFSILLFVAFLIICRNLERASTKVEDTLSSSSTRPPLFLLISRRIHACFERKSECEKKKKDGPHRPGVKIYEEKEGGRKEKPKIYKYAYKREKVDDRRRQPSKRRKTCSSANQDF